MTASGIASRIIGFFYRIFLAQTIGAEALGIYQLIAPVFAMCFALTASSIQTSISKFVGDACGKNAGTSQGEITARGYLLLGLVISCTASVIVGIFLYTQADWIALHFLGELRCAPLLSLLSFSMLPCCIHACINGYYYGKKNAFIPSLCQLIEQLARVGSVWLIYQYTLEKGMELTAFHAVAGLVAGECSGLITSLIAMSLEKRLPGHSYHTLSGQWKTMGKLFASMAVPLTINRVTTALFNSLENLLIPQKLQAFGYSASDALSIFGILTGMTMSIILFPSVLTNSFSVLLLPAVSEAHSAHNHAQIARTIKKAILYGLLLGFVNDITAGPIASQQAKEKEEAYKAVFADAASFETVTSGEDTDLESYLDENGYKAQNIDEVMLAKDDQGNELGYAFTVTTSEGYGGDIQFAMGVQDDGTLNGISILSISETAGLGMRATTDDFKNQFKDKNVEKFTYTKTGATSDDEIDALSGATITTNAMTNGVNAGLAAFRYEKGGSQK